MALGRAEQASRIPRGSLNMQGNCGEIISKCALDCGEGKTKTFCTFHTKSVEIIYRTVIFYIVRSSRVVILGTEVFSLPVLGLLQFSGKSVHGSCGLSCYGMRSFLHERKSRVSQEVLGILTSLLGKIIRPNLK